MPWLPPGRSFVMFESLSVAGQPLRHSWIPPGPRASPTLLTLFFFLLLLFWSSPEMWVPCTECLRHIVDCSRG